MPRITTLQFLEALYPGPLSPGQLVLWSKTRQSGTKHCDWTHNLAHAARVARRYRKTRDVYVGVTLQQQHRAVRRARRRRPRVNKQSVRGSEASASLLPALWACVDVAGPNRRGIALPQTRDAALGLLAAVQLPPSIIVDSGRGFHFYWLLREPLRIDSRAARRRAKDLVRRLQGALAAAAAAQGWTIRQSANLAQVLRLPGTYNHKCGHSKLVRVEHFPLVPSLGDFHYQPEDFDDLTPPPQPALGNLLFQIAPREEQTPADLRPMFERCAFLQRCWEERTELPAEEFDDLANLLPFCELEGVGGRRLLHVFGRDHPGYVASDTDDKIDLALERAEPAPVPTLPTCAASAAAAAVAVRISTSSPAPLCWVARWCAYGHRSRPSTRGRRSPRQR